MRQRPCQSAHRRLSASIATMCLACLLPPSAQAQTTSKPFKFTVGRYAYHNSAAGDADSPVSDVREHDIGKDVNLRWTDEDTHIWGGHYEDHTFGKQSRFGADTSWSVTDGVALQPSFQAASGGFRGGSLNAVLGTQTFAIVGWGRTNLKPYANLNFDPNDAITLGLGRVFENRQTWTLSVIRDDRLNTGQTHRHLIGRIPVGADRLTVDLLYKTGRGESGNVKGWGLSLTWDFPDWFIRLAHDPKQGFTAQDATRLAAGVRF